MPVSDICSVRGMGVAVSVSTSTSARMRLSFSLCATPKRCSSVNDHQAEILEGDVFLQQTVRPMMISSPPAATRARVSYFAREHKSGHAADTDGAVGETLLKVVKCCSARIVVGTSTAVCAPAAATRRRAKRHLRLAIAHIAADQPIHGALGGEVFKHRFNGRPLVRRLLEGKGIGKRAVLPRPENQRTNRAPRAAGHNLEQLPGKLGHILSDFSSSSSPRSCRKAR